MSACNNFVEQLWRKGKCSNCFQSKERHQNTVLAEADVRKEELINSQSQGRQAFKPKNNSGILKEENDEEKTILESASVIKTIAPLATRDDKIVTEADERKTEQGAKSSVGIKPKPVLRTKPRVPTGTVDSEKHVISCDENPLKSEDVLSDSMKVEDSLGKSHNESRCNAKFIEETEPLCSKPDDDLQVSKRANKANIEPVSDTIINNEEARREVDDSIDSVTAERRNLVKISSKNDIDDITENEREFLNLEIENDSGSDLDEYVPMKRNIVLFTDEPAKERNALETDHVGSNTIESHGRMTCEPRTITAPGTCDSEVDEESEQSSCVLEFRNPLCFITNDMEMDDNERRNDTCDKLNLNEISNEFNSAKPSYVNRSGSTCSNKNGSNNHDSGYENTRSSSGNISSHGASNNSGVHSSGKLYEEDIIISSEGTPDVLCEKNGYVVMESSGASNSSWGSSTWDSCRESDFQESSCEGLHVEKASGKLNTGNNIEKPQSEMLKNKLSNVQTVASEKCGNNTDHVSENTTSKPFTKPYKVVDISTGVECPTTEDQNDVPPLPPKEKDRKKDRIDEFKHHVYLEPSDQAPMLPEQGPPDEEKETVPTLKGNAFSSPPPCQTIRSVVEKSPAIHRAPAPRPRSRVPSQFGSTPKPTPRTSRIITDVPKTENTEVQTKKMVNSPPIGKSLN